MPKWRVKVGYAYPIRPHHYIAQGTVFEASRDEVEPYRIRVEEVVDESQEESVVECERDHDPEAEPLPFPPARRRGRPPKNRAFQAPPEDRAF